jgi:hypothetical protein
MSVFPENHGRGAHYRGQYRGQNRTSGAFHHSSRARWSVFAARRPEPPRRPEAAVSPRWGGVYERAETLIQIVLAFALVGGATAALNSSFPGAPPSPALIAHTTASVPYVQPEVEAVDTFDVPVAASSQAVAAPEATPAIGGLPVALPEGERFLDAQMQSVPALTAPAAVEALPASLLDARSISDQREAEADPSPRPLAPPSAEMREKLAARDMPPDVAVASETSIIPASGEAGERLTRCFLKISGQPHESSACRIRQSAEEVVFQFADKTLIFSHERGRAWIATLGGRKIGRVYQNTHKPCWGARGSGFYACDNT